MINCRWLSDTYWHLRFVVRMSTLFSTSGHELFARIFQIYYSAFFKLCWVGERVFEIPPRSRLRNKRINFAHCCLLFVNFLLMFFHSSFLLIFSRHSDFSQFFPSFFFSVNILSSYLSPRPHKAKYEPAYPNKVTSPSRHSILWMQRVITAAPWQTRRNVHRAIWPTREKR